MTLINRILIKISLIINRSILRFLSKFYKTTPETTPESKIILSGPNSNRYVGHIFTDDRGIRMVKMRTGETVEWDVLKKTPVNTENKIKSPDFSIKDIKSIKMFMPRFDK